MTLATPLPPRKLARVDVDAEDVSCVLAHRIPEVTVAVFHTGFLGVVEEADCDWLPAPVFFGFDASCLVNPKDTADKGLFAQFGNTQ